MYEMSFNHNGIAKEEKHKSLEFELLRSWVII